MRLTAPRIAPAPADSWTDEQRQIVEPMLARGSVLNIFRTLLTHPAAAKAFLVWGRQSGGLRGLQGGDEPVDHQRGQR